MARLLRAFLIALTTFAFDAFLISLRTTGFLAAAIGIFAARLGLTLLFLIGLLIVRHVRQFLSLPARIEPTSPGSERSDKRQGTSVSYDGTTTRSGDPCAAAVDKGTGCEPFAVKTVPQRTFSPLAATQ